MLIIKAVAILGDGGVKGTGIAQLSVNFCKFL